MNDFRFSAVPLAWTCSADTIVPWMTSSSTPAAIAGPASTEAFCGDSRIDTVPPASRRVWIASVSRSTDTGSEYTFCRAAMMSSGSSAAAPSSSRSSITRCGSGYRAHSPSPSSTPSPPSAETAPATVGETMASVGWVSSGMSNR